MKLKESSGKNSASAQFHEAALKMYPESSYFKPTTEETTQKKDSKKKWELKHQKYSKSNLIDLTEH